MNSIGILERNYTSSRLQLKVNNLQISLDRLDEAHAALLTETKALVDLRLTNIGAIFTRSSKYKFRPTAITIK